MLAVFIGAERDYLDWTATNEPGFIVNVDHDRVSREYPMIHRATHKALTTPKNENYTTNRFFKVCSDNIPELEHWAQQDGRAPLRPCRICMRG
jgi:putative restriction endonuclease